jgi:hypothetical protein
MIFRPSNLNFPCGLGMIRSESGVIISEEDKKKKKIKIIKLKRRIKLKKKK